MIWAARACRMAMLLLLSWSAAPCGRAESPSARPLVVDLVLHDTVQPISAAYLKRGLEEAAGRHAALVVISLDTPGGLLESTRAMVAEIEHSAVPVVIYVSPGGARAGSAGFFLLEAADIAAMAPATNAGASHPIVEGANSTGMDPILKQKIENDAAAFLRSFVAPRGRNVQAAEDAVRSSKSYSAEECLTLHLIDRISPSESDLLRSLNGVSVRRFDGSTRVLSLADARQVQVLPSGREQLLTRLTDPNLAVLLVLAGILLIYVEFNVPGTIIPGSLGALLLLLGLFGLNLLPIRQTAVALLLAGLVLLLLELKIASHGVLAFLGTVALVLGLATLVDAPAEALRVHPATALAAGLAFSAISGTLAWLALRARRNKRLLGPDALVGRIGAVQVPLLAQGESPAGQVEVNGELWRAALVEGGQAPRGVAVIVRSITGLELAVALVRPAQAPIVAEVPIAAAPGTSNR